MKVCFVGVGSIAGRHIRNLAEIYQGKELQIDVLRSGKGRPLTKELSVLLSRQYTSFEQLPADYDVIFVTNPTSCHYDTIRQLAGKTRSFFIEKPVFSKEDADIDALGLPAETICYVAAPLRYHSVLTYVKEKLDLSKVYSVRAISSSYLPDWRPGTDYRQTYSAKKALGGGVAIDLIHEWDYLTWLFGLPEQVFGIQGKFSDLEIDSEDAAVYIARYPDKLAELHLDYFGRTPIRCLELFTAEETIVCDLLQYQIDWLKSGEKIQLPQGRDTFQKAELQHFLDILAGKAVNENDIRHACRVMKLAKGYQE